MFKTNHHFLIDIDIDGHDEQQPAGSQLSVVRRSESAVLPSAPFEDPSPASLARQVSVSRSGRYKSKTKTKQRVRLMNIGVDFANAKDDGRRSSTPAVLDPSFAASADKRKNPVQQPAVKTSEPTQLEQRKTHVVMPTASAEAHSKPPPRSKESTKSYDHHSSSPKPSDTADVGLAPAVAETDESTDL